MPHPRANRNKRARLKSGKRRFGPPGRKGFTTPAKQEGRRRAAAQIKTPSTPSPELTSHNRGQKTGNPFDFKHRINPRHH